MRLVDGDALKRKMQKVATEAWKMKLNAPIEKIFNQCMDYIDSAPTIEPKQGEWIDGKCDQCGGHAPFWSMASTYYKSNYCPSCGARMKKGADDE